VTKRSRMSTPEQRPVRWRHARDWRWAQASRTHVLLREDAKGGRRVRVDYIADSRQSHVNLFSASSWSNGSSTSSDPTESRQRVSCTRCWFDCTSNRTWGNERLDRLQPETIEEWLADLERSGIGLRTRQAALLRLRTARTVAGQRLTSISMRTLCSSNGE
jgi:hypothetical protein